jgi:glycosyltransferase involved in cell wall biosynthesis
MRIAIDLTALMPRQAGVDRYLTELVRHLAKIDRENRYSVFVNAADRWRFDGEFGSNMSIRTCCPRSRPVRLLFQQCALPLASAVARYDVIHSPSFLMPLWRGRSRHLLSVHDMTIFSMPALHNRLRRSAVFRRGIAVSIRRAHLVNVPSEATRRDLLRWIPEAAPEKVRITPYGIEPRFSPAPRGEVEKHVARLGLPQPYILHVGTIEPRKNLITLLESYGRLVGNGHTGAHLVLAGALGWAWEEILRKAAAPELRGRVHLAGYVADEDLPWVYRGASMFVYPSLYEGFGFPPLEAMACGVPVIASRSSALEENLRGAAELVPPSDAAALAAAMRGLEEDRERHERLAKLGLERAVAFRWEETARSVLACYRELGERG